MTTRDCTRKWITPVSLPSASLAKNKCGKNILLVGITAT
jgi:hypothetical protein